MCEFLAHTVYTRFHSNILVMPIVYLVLDCVKLSRALGCPYCFVWEYWPDTFE